MHLQLLAISLFLAAGADDKALPAAPPPPTRPPIDCRDNDHRALDFWLGTWAVSDTASKTPIATSRIELILDGCVVRESFDQTVGQNATTVHYLGSSYSTLNPNDGHWRQFYADSAGRDVSYSGGIENGAMVFISSHTTPGGAAVSNRLTLAPQPDGTVRQSGDVSLDHGKTWSRGYDFTYRHP